MNAFVQRIANYLANEIIVKHLAQSKTFQKMALRTHLNVEKTKEFVKQGVEKAETEGLEGLKKGMEASAGAAGSAPKGVPIPPRKGFGGFVEAFVKEVKKDFGG